MKKIFIKFPSTGKIYLFETDLSLGSGQEILAENDGIVEQAVLVEKPENGEAETGNGKIIRIVSSDDRVNLVNLKKQARGYLEESRKKVFRHGLNMKILDVDISFDEKKLTFYFCAAGRVDFRSLVTDLAKSYNKLIRLQQVGSRDEAKHFGGIGRCGRELCCSKFLNNLESVTLEMAQTQELSTSNTNKLFGCCGKLMCCLAFEAQNYQELKKKMPKIGSKYSSPKAEGIVSGYSILEGKIVVETKKGEKVEVFV
ncbi:MAG: Regulator of signaling phosphorelay (PSP1/tpl family) protein [Berkelbacteria bacterium GW2011_GWB1_38_5]|uniref:Regulator of signaling phosphorelay (PSP1/tpl family) protein n=2 Tax=Candidatus Berkelbacteria TaxID=1618330 RepID=A0A0G0LJ45_9BACT|nr:MAG: Regulator of signaling phosphorelay (PSP1/tpl family) protein [Berkelbacteria bacterium GW2011_GWB1_38_5]KKQ91067.1 MAG: Regulator of signaling phosphorelay (PSP1/tpl family) protein [Berkelbacteria bacterium GW2011_GWA1_39_10]